MVRAIKQPIFSKAGTELLRQHHETGDRSRLALSTSFLHRIESDWWTAWAEDLPYYIHLDDHTTIAKNDLFAWMEARPGPIAWTPSETHRVGTCFDIESVEMREACVDPIKTYLNAQAVVHEVRHQRSAYHTDLVYADIDNESLNRRANTSIGTEPLHDPLQRFRVWWYIIENEPIPRGEFDQNGLYADPDKNRKHLEWLLEHGYVAQTAAHALTAIKPPSIATLHAVELKRRDWETALEQAARARRSDLPEYRSELHKDRYGYADYAWVALDAGAIIPALEHADRFRDAGVGLLAIAEGGTVIEHIEADHRPRGRYTRDRAYVESQIWKQIKVDETTSESDDTQPVQSTLTNAK